MSERIEKLLAFLKDAPDDCFLNHALALEYVKIDDDEKARNLFEKNKANDANYVATYYHLGKLLERVGNPNEAIAIYEEGMQVAKNANDQHSYNELQAAHDDLAY